MRYCQCEYECESKNNVPAVHQMLPLQREKRNPTNKHRKRAKQNEGLDVRPCSAASQENAQHEDGNKDERSRAKARRS